jgi:hypothetical protein
VADALMPMTWLDWTRSEVWYALGFDPPMAEAERLLWEETTFPLDDFKTIRDQLREFLATVAHEAAT